ncbi:hypothetical protein ALC57_14584, partial [Trachymyrmex cornetzi]
LKDIPKFERLNAVSINVYGIENGQILPLRLKSGTKEKHINLQDPRNDSVAYFVWIKNLSRLVSSQLTRKEHKKFFCDRDKREDKFLTTLYDKKRYIIHYRNLQQCTRHGLRVTKIHRVLQFAQSPWLRDYIELNTQFRTLAKNDFEKNLYKLMNNAVFGKTMENVRNHVDVKLVTKWDGRYGAEAMIAKPNFHSRSVFAENLIAVEMCKLEVKFNKPIYVGMCILDISKICLYEFHHEYMLPMYRDKCQIMYTDTDSLIYRIECDDA